MKTYWTYFQCSVYSSGEFHVPWEDWLVGGGEGAAGNEYIQAGECGRVCWKNPVSVGEYGGSLNSEGRGSGSVTVLC